MKLRIFGNSLRVRLSRTEVGNFAETGHLQEETVFGSQVLSYSLEAKTGIQGLQATFEGTKITMYVPAEIPAAWAANEVVGYDNTIDTGAGNQLCLLLEKDFKCIDAAPHEDQSDNFENPNTVC